jgi:hypothetical protein
MPAYEGDRFDPPAPVARVSLRHPESGTSIQDIPMLIDSGADVSLVPTSSVNRLGAAVESAKGYELIGFDGSRSVSPTVRLDLLFLGRAFKGRFLLIDQESGFLGRDILKHLTILLDGPRSMWAEHPAGDD